MIDRLYYYDDVDFCLGHMLLSRARNRMVSLPSGAFDTHDYIFFLFFPFAIKYHDFLFIFPRESAATRQLKFCKEIQPSSLTRTRP